MFHTDCKNLEPQGLRVSLNGTIHEFELQNGCDVALPVTINLVIYVQERE